MKNIDWYTKSPPPVGRRSLTNDDEQRAYTMTDLCFRKKACDAHRWKTIRLEKGSYTLSADQVGSGDFFNVFEGYSSGFEDDRKLAVKVFRTRVLLDRSDTEIEEMVSNIARQFNELKLTKVRTSEIFNINTLHHDGCLVNEYIPGDTSEICETWCQATSLTEINGIAKKALEDVCDWMRLSLSEVTEQDKWWMVLDLKPSNLRLRSDEIVLIDYMELRLPSDEVYSHFNQCIRLLSEGNEVIREMLTNILDEFFPNRIPLLPTISCSQAADLINPDPSPKVHKTRNSLPIRVLKKLIRGEINSSQEDNLLMSEASQMSDDTIGMSQIMFGPSASASDVSFSPTPVKCNTSSSNLKGIVQLFTQESQSDAESTRHSPRKGLKGSITSDYLDNQGSKPKRKLIMPEKVLHQPSVSKRCKSDSPPHLSSVDKKQPIDPLVSKPKKSLPFAQSSGPKSKAAKKPPSSPPVFA